MGRWLTSKRWRKVVRECEDEAHGTVLPKYQHIRWLTPRVPCCAPGLFLCYRPPGSVIWTQRWKNAGGARSPLFTAAYTM